MEFEQKLGITVHPSYKACSIIIGTTIRSMGMTVSQGVLVANVHYNRSGGSMQFDQGQV